MLPVVSTPPTRSVRERNVYYYVLLVLIGAIYLVPFHLTLSGDDEGLYTEVVSLVHQGRAINRGHFPFWNSFLGIGMPHPLNPQLTFHPAVLLIDRLPIDDVLRVFYQVHLWIGIFAMWLLCRQVRIRRPAALLCVVTFTLSAPTNNYALGIDFWPASLVVWTLLPLLYCLIRLLEVDSGEARYRYSVLTGLCAGFMVLNGSLGLLCLLFHRRDVPAARMSDARGQARALGARRRGGESAREWVGSVQHLPRVRQVHSG